MKTGHRLRGAAMEADPRGGGEAGRTPRASWRSIPAFLVPRDRCVGQVQ